MLASHPSGPEALTAGFHRALLTGSIFLVAAAVIAFRTTDTRGETGQAAVADVFAADAADEEVLA
jgi:hypothetical protein